MARSMTAAGWKGAAWAVHKSETISKADKLAFFREIRGRKVLPEEATFFLIGWEAVLVYERRYEADPEMRKIIEAMNAIEEKHGVDDWPSGRGPKKYQALSRKWSDRKAVIVAKVLRELGEPEMAALYLADMDRFDRLHRKGREYFYREFDPENSEESLMKRLRKIQGREKQQARRAA